LFHMLARSPIMPVAIGFRHQPIDPGEVAEHIVTGVSERQTGRLPDLAGPEVLTLAAMLRAWLAVRGLRRLILPIPVPGKVGAGFRAGYSTVPGRPYGRISWAEWLHHRYNHKPGAKNSPSLE
jgi:uncharacterized protein YbjT (DUF2867 family)